MGKEVISIFTGQAGVQLGHAFWEQIAGEYGIEPNGEMPNDAYLQLEKAYNLSDPDQASFYFRGATNNWVPRGFLIDLEPTVVDEIRTGLYKNMFHPDFLISASEDAANVFSRGYHTTGRIIINRIIDSLRRHIEECETLQALLFFHSMGGGTGTGLTSLMYDEIHEEFNKTTKIDCSIVPSRLLATNNVEPYNCSLAFHAMEQHCDVNFLFDNASLYKISANQLDVKNPNYNTINRMLSQVFSSLTSCFRYGGALTGGMNELQTNLVPYPRIHYPLCSYAPIWNEVRYTHDKRSITALTKAVFDYRNQMLEVDVKTGRYMSCVVIYRGPVNASECYNAITNIKRSAMQFVDWCPTGFKIAICKQSPVVVKQSNICCSDINTMLMTNTSAVGEVFRRLIQKQVHLYSHKAFIHWFIAEGMEESEFQDCQDNIMSLVSDYEQCSNTDGQVKQQQPQKKQPQQKQKQQQPSKKAAPRISSSSAGGGGGQKSNLINNVTEENEATEETYEEQDTEEVNQQDSNSNAMFLNMNNQGNVMKFPREDCIAEEYDYISTRHQILEQMNLNNYINYKYNPNDSDNLLARHILNVKNDRSLMSSIQELSTPSSGIDQIIRSELLYDNTSTKSSTLSHASCLSEHDINQQQQQL